MPETPAVAGSTAPASPPPRRRRRLGRRVILVAVILVVLISLLVLLAPTLISTPPGRALVVGIANRQINGHLEIGQLDIGWFTATEMDNVYLVDASGSPVAQLHHLGTNLTLLDALRGKYALGKTTIDGLRLHAQRNAAGEWNFHSLLKPSKSGQSEESADRQKIQQPTTLPDLSGQIVLTDAQATIQQPGQPPITIPLTADVQVPSVNAPITDKLNASVQVGSAAPGTIALEGSANVIKANQLALDTARVNQRLDLTGINLAALLPLLPSGAGITAARGNLECHVFVNVPDGKSLLASLDVTGQHLALAGPALKGDTYTTGRLSLSLPHLAADFPTGLSDWTTGQLHMSRRSLTSPLALTVDQGSITTSLEGVPQALLNLASNHKPGASAQLSLQANLDLAKLAAVLKNSLQLASGLNLTSGTLTHVTTLTTDAQKASLASTTDIAKVAGVAANPGQPPHPVALHQPIHLDLAAADFAGNGAIPDLRDLHLNFSSSFAGGSFSGANLAAVQGQVIGHFQQLQAELGQFVQMDPTPMSGDFSLMLNSHGDLTTPGGTATLTAVASVNHFTRGTTTNLPWAALTLAGNLHHGSGDLFIDALTNGSISLQSGDPQSPTTELTGSDSATFAAGSTAPPAAPAPQLLPGVQQASLSLAAPNLAALQQLADAFSTSPTLAVAAPPGSASSAPAAAPLRLTGGSIALRADLAHRDRSLLLNVPELTAANVSFTRGSGACAMRPVHVQLAVEVDPASAAPGAGASLLGEIHQVRVTHLTGDLGVATLSMPTPITLTDLSSAAPTATGTLQLGAALQEVGPLLAALQGEPASAFPYAGKLSATQAIRSDQAAISLDGTLQIEKFQVLNTASPISSASPAAVPTANAAVPAAAAGATASAAAPTTAPSVLFSEDQLRVADNLQLRDGLNSVTINNLNVAMQSSKALGVSIQHGTIDDLAGARRIALTAAVDYDLAKLWPIVHPLLLTPGQPDSYADVQMGGAFHKSFRIDGAYPANLPFQQAIAQLEINGDLAVGSFSHGGLAVKNLDVPTTMGHGMLATIIPGKPAGQNTEPPATANDGQLDLGNLFVDLTQSPPRLSSATPGMAVMKNVTVNPLFSRTFLARIINNPLFAGAQQASGLFTLQLDRCVNLPLGELVTQHTAANTGQANLRFSLTNLNIGVQGLGDLGSVLKQDSFTANVNDGTVAIAGGFATQHMVFNTGSYNITFDGKVALDTDQLMPLTVTLPGSRIARAATSDPNVLKYVPDQVSVVMTGTLEHPQVRMDQVLQKLLAGAAQKAALGNLGGLLGGGGNNSAGGGARGGNGGGGGAPASSQPADQSNDNPLGSLLQGLQRKKQH